ncbi:SEL1-like repeat protein [Xenorhabdus lircayensis]|uniref:SEL1-like repeat protein n=1 Tax=Xenorhabdus lircayensis TaxID=2763499 RepID=UPI0038CD5AE2
MKAQNNIGYFYSNGLGVKQDRQNALEWYKKSVEADQSLTEAKFSVKKLTKKLNRGKETECILASECTLWKQMR